uniref:Uncharacterized protein n=1 Tax=Colwellia sp. C1 TaxID=1737566 RepID=A0A0P0L7K7_9GAMM|nr:hypothetical protein [Colwellia sp. C1]
MSDLWRDIFIGIYRENSVMDTRQNSWVAHNEALLFHSVFVFLRALLT